MKQISTSNRMFEVSGIRNGFQFQEEAENQNLPYCFALVPFPLPRSQGRWAQQLKTCPRQKLNAIMHSWQFLLDPCPDGTPCRRALNTIFQSCRSSSLSQVFENDTIIIETCNTIGEYTIFTRFLAFETKVKVFF